MGGDLVTGVSVRKGGAGLRLAPFARKQLRWVFRGGVDMAPRVKAIILTENVPCGVSGSASVAFDDADNNVSITAGDRFTITFTNCVDDTDMTSLNGAMSMTLNRINGNPETDLAWDMDVTMTLTNLVVAGGGDTTTIDGDLNFSLATQDSINYTGSVRGNSLAVTVNGVAETLSDYLISFTSNDATLAYTVDASGTVSSTELGGSVQFDTLVPFEGVDPDYPHTGVMKIIGENNTSVTLTVIDSTSVELDVDADGDGSGEQSMTTQWERLDS